jgi:cupin superfamily acireductone dioxygenase involved in methionine salvage
VKDRKQLKADIKAQKEENEVLYKKMKKAVLEAQSQRRKIEVYKAKIEELEQHVGMVQTEEDIAPT